jgi:hypothetical protein
MALGSTQPPTKISTRNISLGYRRPVHRADNLATFIVLIVLKSGSLNFLEPSGPVTACNGITLPLHLHVLNTICSSSGDTAYTTIDIICVYYVGWLLPGLEWNYIYRYNIPIVVYAVPPDEKIVLKTCRGC